MKTSEKMGEWHELVYKLIQRLDMANSETWWEPWETIPQSHIDQLIL